MQRRLKKIDHLLGKGYILHQSLGGIYHKLVTPRGEEVITFIGNISENDSLPGFSPIAFWFYPYVAVQIRHWKYFWLIGTINLIFQLVLLISNSYELIFSYRSAGVILGIIYGFNYPYQKWMFSKSNKNQISVWKSFFIAPALLFITLLPAAFIEGMRNQ